MTDKALNLWSKITKEYINVLYRNNGDQTYSQHVVVGKTSIVSAEFTRENNATPYAVGDVISGSADTPLVYELPNIMRVPGGTGIIGNVRVIFNVKSVVPALRINFFNAANPTIAGDNLPHKELYIDTGKRIGSIDLPVMTTPYDVTNSDISKCVSSFSSGIPVQAAPTSKSLWVLLNTLTVVTLTALSKVTVVVTVFND